MLVTLISAAAVVENSPQTPASVSTMPAPFHASSKRMMQEVLFPHTPESASAQYVQRLLRQSDIIGAEANTTSPAFDALVKKHYGTWGPWMLQSGKALTAAATSMPVVGEMAPRIRRPTRTLCNTCQSTVENIDTYKTHSIYNDARILAVEGYEGLRSDGKLSDEIHGAPSVDPSRDTAVHEQMAKLVTCPAFIYDACWRDDGGIWRFLVPCPYSLTCACAPLPGHLRYARCPPSSPAPARSRVNLPTLSRQTVPQL